MKKLAIVILGLMVLCSTSFARDYSAKECPVVGNTDSGIFHVPGKVSYGKMLRKNKRGDNRKCFKTMKEAKNAGYRAAKR